MRIALFGGTFDPIHWGHLLLAESARVSHRLDRVIFLPAGQPPHKFHPVASAAHRLRMLHLATRGNPDFEVNDWEIRQKRVVYTHETIDHFRRQRPKDKLHFIVGMDMLKDVPRWKTGTQLFSQCTFLAADRPGVSWTSLPAGLRKKAKRIEWPAVPLASHEIRARVKKRASIRYQVPDAVERYIWKHRLYR